MNEKLLLAVGLAAVSVSMFFVFMLRGNSADSFADERGDGNLTFALCADAEGCACEYVTEGNFTINMQINGEGTHSGTIVGSASVFFSPTAHEDGVATWIDMEIERFESNPTEGSGTPFTPPEELSPELKGSDVTTPAAPSFAHESVTSEERESFYAEVEAGPKVTKEDDLMLEHPVRYTMRYGKAGEIVAPESESVRILNMKKNLIAQLQISCPLEVGGPYEVQEVGDNGDQYNATYNVVQGDAADELLITKVVSYESKLGEEKRVKVDAVVAVNGNHGILRSATLIGEGRGELLEVDGVAKSEGGNDVTIEASVRTTWTCSTGSSGSGDRRRRLEDYWADTETRKTGLPKEKDPNHVGKHLRDAMLKSVTEFGVHPYRVDSAMKASMLLHRHPEAFDVALEAFEHDHFTLNKIARFVFYGMLCAGESEDGLDWLHNRLENGSFDADEAEQLRTEIMCLKNALADDEAQARRRRPGARSGARPRGELNDEEDQQPFTPGQPPEFEYPENITQNLWEEEQNLWEEDEEENNVPSVDEDIDQAEDDEEEQNLWEEEEEINVPAVGEDIDQAEDDDSETESHTKVRDMLESIKRKGQSNTRDRNSDQDDSEFEYKDGGRKLWGHRHRPHRHNPHRHSRHRHNPHRHNPHGHNPHRHNPHRHNPHRHNPHRHNPHRHDPHHHKSPGWCGSGYDDITTGGFGGSRGGNLRFWRCGDRCPVGRFYTDTSCNCACQKHSGLGVKVLKSTNEIYYDNGGGGTWKVPIDTTACDPGANCIVEGYETSELFNALNEGVNVNKGSVKKRFDWTEAIGNVNADGTCSGVCIQFRNGWHVQRPYGGNRWASGDKAGSRGVQLVQGQRFAFGMFGWDFVVYEMATGVRSLDPRAGKQPGGTAGPSDHGVWNKLTLFGANTGNSGGNGGWLPFQWFIGQNSDGLPKKLGTMNAKGSSLATQNCAFHPMHCTQCAPGAPSDIKECTGQGVTAPLLTEDSIENRCMVHQGLGAGGWNPDQHSSASVTKVAQMAYKLKQLYDEATCKQKAKKKTSPFSEVAVEVRTDDAGSIGCDTKCPKWTEQIGMICNFNMEFTSDRIAVGFGIGTSLSALIKLALNSVSGGTAGTVAGWVIDAVLDVLGIRAEIMFAFELFLESDHLYRNLHTERCHTAEALSRLYQHTEGAIGLSVSAELSLSFIFVALNLRFSFVPIEGKLTTSGVADYNGLRNYQSGASASSLRSDGSIWIWIGVSIPYPCGFGWTGIKWCHWTKSLLDHTFTIFAFNGVTWAGSYENLQRQSTAHFSRRLENAPEGELLFQDGEPEEWTNPDLNSSAPQGKHTRESLNLDPKIHLSSSAVQISTSTEFCDGTYLKCGEAKLVDGLTETVVFGYGYEYYAEIIFDQPKEIAKVKVHDCPGLLNTGDLRVLTWSGEPDETWEIFYDGFFYRGEITHTPAVENVKALRIDGKQASNGAWCIAEIEVMSTSTAAELIKS